MKIAKPRQAFRAVSLSSIGLPLLCSLTSATLTRAQVIQMSTTASAEQVGVGSGLALSDGTSPLPDFVTAYITITAASEDEATGSRSNPAEELATKLVESGLVACVNIVPKVTSIYTWEGKVQKDAESLLIVKTRRSHTDKVTQFVRENHPYTVPEVIFMPIVAGNPSYLDWLHSSTAAPKYT